MGMFILSMALLLWRVELKCVTTAHMAQCVMTSGMSWRPQWSVHNWDTVEMVRYKRRLYVHTSLCCILSGSIPVRNAGFGDGSGSILLDNLVCEGDESSLLDCASDVAIGNSDCQHSEDAGVRCEGS